VDLAKAIVTEKLDGIPKKGPSKGTFIVKTKKGNRFLVTYKKVDGKKTFAITKYDGAP
jgi:hypothetical protein